MAAKRTPREPLRGCQGSSRTVFPGRPQSEKNCARVPFFHLKQTLLHFQSLRHRVGRYVEARNDGRVPGQTRPLKAGAARVLFAAFQEGELARSEALGLTGEHSERNARRLLSQLRDEGLLSETNNRSPLRWEIPEHAEPWYFPELTPGV